MKSRLKPLAFSLVELVIVVVIIGVIAAIAVPRISRGAKGAHESSVRGSLAGLRNAIDMYAAEHGGTFPGADGQAATFLNQLTKKTDAAGNVGTTAGVHIYGPYLRGGIPPLEVGPNKGASEVLLGNTGPAVDEVQTTIGWVYNYTTGDIIANTDDADESGKTYDTY
jgi:prepilin-type N-terminal cleavage/methylation domain-containing protein